MRASTHASPDDIDLVTLWGSLRRSLPRLLVVTILTGLATFVVLSLIAPRYTSEAQLAIVARSTNPFPDGREKSASPDSVTPRMDKEAINTHVKAIIAPDIVLKVADELKLRTKVEFNSALGNLDFIGGVLRIAGLTGPRAGESDEDRVLAVVYRQLEVSAAKESRFIPIRFSSSDPLLAAEFANRLAETYRRSLVDETIQETGDVAKALAPKVEQLRKELMEAEAEVERYRVQIDRTIGGQTRTPLIDQRLAELTAEHSKAEALKSEADVKWRTARELMQAGSADLIPDVQRSPLLQGLIQQRVRLERQISELSASLLPGHPRMQQLNADLAGLRRQISGEIQKFVQSLEKETRVGALRVDAIARQISDLKARVVSTSNDDARLKGIEAAAKAKRSELERLEKQLEDNNTIVVTKTVPIEARIVSPARASSVPTFPRKGPYSLLAMAATMLFGLAWIITRELIVGARPATSGGRGSGGFSRRGGSGRPDAEPALAGAASAAAADATPPRPAPAAAPAPSPAAKAAPAAVPPATLAGPVAPAAAGSHVRSPADVAERLLARFDVQSGLRTLVASESSVLDPTPEAVAVARALAAAGRQVVLLDWSLVGKSSLPGGSRAPGMTELLLGKATFEEVIAPMPGSDIHMIPCGRALESDEEIAELDSDRLNLVLDALDEAYDHIVATGSHEDVQVLFEVTQGRFDAGVVVSEPSRRVPVLDGQPNTLLGFEVAEIDIIHLERTAKPDAAAVARPAAPAPDKSAGKPAPPAKGKEKPSAAKAAPAAAPAKPAAKDKGKEQAAPAAPPIPANRLKLARGDRPEARPS